MPDFLIENEYKGIVCGIDEAGRGPWIGNVVAGAVIILDRALSPELLDNLNDSKKLSKAKREHLYALLRQAENAGQIKIGVGEATPAEIDEYNILQATFMAMRRAVENLGIKADMALIDGNRLDAKFPIPSRAIISFSSAMFSGTPCPPLWK